MVISNSACSETSCVSANRCGKHTVQSLNDDVCNVFAKKQVRINEDCNEVFYQSLISSSVDRSHSWYSSSDYRKFRACFARDLSRLKTSKRSTALVDLYSLCCGVSYKLSDVSEVVSADFNTVATAFQHAHNSTSLGFESKVTRISNSETGDRAEAIQDVVQDIQQEYDEGEWDVEEDYAEELRECCMAFSQADCLFAQIIGKIHRLEVVGGQQA